MRKTNRIATVALCATLPFASIASAETVSVTFEAVVQNVSFGVDVNIGDAITGSLTYETDLVLQGGDGLNFGYYNDNTQGSQIEVTVNGITYNTSAVAITPLNINRDLVPNFTLFSSNDINEASNGDFVFGISLAYESAIPAPSLEIADTFPQIADIVFSDLFINASNVNFNASLTSISTGPVTPEPIDVDIAHNNVPVPATGGRMYFGRHVKNNSATTQSFKRWEYIIWPNGVHYNRNRPKNFTLLPGEETNQTGASYRIPAIWPAGEYEYHINTLTVPNAEYSHDTFTFTKE